MPRITQIRNPKMGPGPGGFITSHAKGNDEAVRFVPLGGLEEVGRNCSFLEYKNEIVVIDMGLQFPEDETPGIDYIIPNTTYLEERKDKIRAMFITHGHLDHIGGLPLVLARIGNPPVYSRNLTVLLMKKRQAEQLFTTMDRLAKLQPALTEEEIDAEIAAARADRARRR